MKRKAIIEDLYQKGIFGQAVTYVYTIEFQKRGLPHMHILIILEDSHKILTPSDIDTTVRAYWPNPTTEPMLFETVKKCMVHTCNNLQKTLSKAISTTYLYGQQGLPAVLPS